MGCQGTGQYHVDTPATCSTRLHMIQYVNVRAWCLTLDDPSEESCRGLPNITRWRGRGWDVARVVLRYASEEGMGCKATPNWTAGFVAADRDVCVYEWYHRCAPAPLAKIRDRGTACW